MAIYTGGDRDNLVALINESNPQLPWELDSENFIYGPPQEITGVNDKQHNTRIRVQAKMSSPYQGSVDLTYRRIKLSTLFRGIKVEIHRWWTGTASMKQILPLINEQFGLNLHDDFGNGPTWTVAQAGQSRVLELSPLNYMYTGSVNIWMYMDKEELGLDVLKVQDIDAVRWPGGDDFTVDRRGQMQFMFTAGDFTEAYQVNHSVGTGNWSWGNSGGAMRDMLRSLRPDLDLGRADGGNENATQDTMIISGSNNGTAINNQNDINNVRNMLRSKAMLDRELPFLDHGFNRIGVYQTNAISRMNIITERDPETNMPVEYIPLTGEAVLKWNMLW